jgi:O-antigen/teichoic acid export membrane protein
MGNIKNLILQLTSKNSTIKKSLVYIGSDVLNKVLPFLLLPVITFYLKPNDYAVLSIYEAIIGFLSVIIGLGSQEMIQVIFFKENRNILKNYIGNILKIIIFTSILFSVFFLVFENYIHTIYNLNFIWLLISLITTLSMFINKIRTSLLIAEGKSVLFAKFQNLSTLFILLTTILFLVVFKWNWQGRILSVALGSFIFALISINYILKYDFINIKTEKGSLKKDISQSISVLPYSLSFWLNNSALLLIMAAVIGKYETGIYAGAMRISIIVNFATLSLNRVWQPMLYKMLSETSNKYNLNIVKKSYLFSGIIVFIGLLLILFSEFIVKIALDKAYYEAILYVKLLIIIVVFQSLFFSAGNFLLFYGKKKLMTIASMSAILIQYLLIYIFYYYDIINLKNLIYIQIFSTFLSLIIASIMVFKVKQLPWFFLLKINKKQL